MTLTFRPFVAAFLGMTGVYLLSFYASLYPFWELPAAVIIVLLAFVLYLRSFTLGTAVVLVELVGGSLGRIFVFPGGLSIRMALFTLAFLATAIYLLLHKELRRPVMFAVKRWPLVLVLLMIAWGTVWGLAQRGPSLVFSDANAYAYFLLLPTFLLAWRSEKDREVLISVIFGAAAATALLTLFELYIFTHNFADPFLRANYKWVRDFGLGEITRAPGGFYRVFLQAHLWNFIVFLWSLPLLTFQRRLHWLWSVGILSASVVVVSFSRTFWLAAAAAALLGLTVTLSIRSFRSSAERYIGILLLLTSLGAALPFVITRSIGSATITRAFSLTGEAAADSRMNLLKVMRPAILERPMLGWGFGKELTYVTRDPRLLIYFPDGNYTTYAFEWGWLDFWLKMGLAGLAAYLALVLFLLGRLWSRIRSGQSRATLALFLSLVGVSLAHFFSPWLNHPLGIGLLLIIFAYSSIEDQ